MGNVICQLSVSLDGFVAGPNDGPEYPLGEGGERLFAWYRNGDTDLPLPGTDMVFRVSRASADFLRDEWTKQGALIVGRRMFDIAGAWQGRPPGGTTCFVVTHAPAREWVRDGSPFVFVTDGVASAVRQAQAIAGDHVVSVGSANIMQQCIALGLLDELYLDVAPTLLGGGVRLFDHLGVTPRDLERLAVVAAPDVTHLRYRIIKA